MKNETRSVASRMRLALACAAAVGVGLAAWTWADGGASQTEVYDALAGTPGTAGFWDKSGYSGSLNSIGTCDCAAVVVGSGAESGAYAETGEKGFEPFGRFALESLARGLDSRAPRGVIIQIY